MPRLNDHGLSDGGKALGVPVYPLNSTSALRKDDVNGTFQHIYGEATATAPENIMEQASCTVGDEMYFMGTNTDKSHCYKYNVKTRVWNRLNDCATTLDKYWAVYVNRRIYYNVGGVIWYYDIDSNTHTKIDVASGHNFTGSRATTDGQDIYVFGGSSSTAVKTQATKFEVSTNTFSGLTAIPVAMYNQGCVYGGDDFIYLFGGTDNPTSAYRFHIPSNVYEKLNNVPNNYVSGMIAKIDNIIYLFNSTGFLYLYAYDTVNGSYTNITTLSSHRYYGHASVVDSVIYMIGGSSGYGTTGESMLVIQAITLPIVIQKLFKGSKCYTDGDVATLITSDFGGQLIIEELTIQSKTNGAVRIPTDGEYALVGSNYVTIGG